MEIDATEHKPDFTANLPDELLHKVFIHLLLRDKLRVESVSHRFQRCVLKLLKMQPQPLVLKTLKNNYQRLNGYILHSNKVCGALRALAKKSKFHYIQLWLRNTNQANRLLAILLEADCLDKVTSFFCSHAASQDVLEKTVAKCGKLSMVNFNFEVGDGSRSGLQSAAAEAVDLNLRAILDNKALTHLSLQLVYYPQALLLELFQSLRPQTLELLRLEFLEMLPLDLAAMVKELNTNAWAALKEIQISWWEEARVRLAEFIDSFALLPALKECHMGLWFEQPDNQFVATITSLFHSAAKITLKSCDGCLLSEVGYVPYCQMMAQIRQVQNVHHNTSVEFSVDPDDNHDIMLTLAQGNGIFEENMYTHSLCFDAQCVDCHRFYPKVLYELEEIMARQRGDAHLEDYQLDKCRIENVVDHLNTRRRDEMACKALSAEINEAQDLVTIAFETCEPIQQYKITVGHGACFSRSCIRCIQI